MSAMEAPRFDLTPDLTRYGLNLLNTKAAGVVDRLKVVKILMLNFILLARQQHMCRYDFLISFGPSRVSHEVSPPAQRYIKVIEEVIPECPTPRLRVNVLIGNPVIITTGNIHYDYPLVTKDTLAALVAHYSCRTRITFNSKW